MSNTIHISELVKGSSAYDAPERTQIHTVLVLESVSIVHATFEGNDFIQVWNCVDGEVPVSSSSESDQMYDTDDAVYHTLLALVSAYIED